MLEQMAKHNSNEDIYEDNLFDTYYPQRPESLKDVFMTLWLIITGKAEMMETESTPN